MINRKMQMDLYGRLIRDVAYPAWEGLIRGRPTIDLMSYLGETEWMSLDALETLQTGLLRRLLRHAYAHTPYYRASMDAAGRASSELTWEQQLILMARYRRGLPLGRIAGALDMPCEHARSLHEDSVLAVHAAMLAEASG